MHNKIGITIDRGHKAGYNPGAYTDPKTKVRYYEGTKQYEFGQYLEDALKAYGIFEVYGTKSTPQASPTLQARADVALKNGSRVLLSCHSNAAGAANSGTVSGTEIMCSVQRKEYYNTAVALTNVIVDTLNQYGSTVSKSRRPVFKKNTSNDLDYWGLLRHASAKPGIEHIYLMEMGFHDHEIECKTMFDSNTLYHIAGNIAAYFYTTLKHLYIPAETTSWEGVVTTGGGLNVRAGANLNSVILATVPKGTKLECIEAFDDYAAKITWLKIRWNGCAAYVSDAFVKLPDNFGKVEPEYNIPTYITKATASVNASLGLNVRIEPDAKSKKLKGMNNKTKFVVDLTHSTNDWLALYPYPTEGYASRAYATVDMSTQEKVEFSETNPEEVVPSTPAWTGTVASSAGLNIRSSASTKASIIKTIPNKTVVDVFGCVDGWATIAYGTYAGYCSEKYLIIKEKVTHTPDTIGLYQCTTSVLNVRCGAGDEFAKIGTLKKGTDVYGVEKCGKWLRIKSASIPDGYVSMTYMKTIDVFESPEVSSTTKRILASFIDDKTVHAITWFTKLLGGRMSSGYGYRTHPVTGKPSSFHQGIDFAATAGTPIICPIEGVVKENYYNSSYGNLLKIAVLDDMTMHYFAHMKVLGLPKPGTLVKRGDIIGYVGTTGSSTGNHLHYEIRKSPWVYLTNNINPDTYDFLK